MSNKISFTIKKNGKNLVMRKINAIVKEIIKIFALFMFAFVWVRYFLKSLWKASIVSAIIVIVYVIVSQFFKKSSLQKSGLKEKEKQEAENMFLSLVYAQNPYLFFEKLLEKKHHNLQVHRQYISISYNLEKSNMVFWFDATYEALSPQKIIAIRKNVLKENPSKIIICCKEVESGEILRFVKKFPEEIVILNQYETYQTLFKPYNMYPKVTQTLIPEKKLSLSDFVAFSFNKKRTKGYLLSAFVLVLSSLFVRQTLYYCLASSILIVFAFISEFNPLFNKKERENPL